MNLQRNNMHDGDLAKPKLIDTYDCNPEKSAFGVEARNEAI